VYLGTIYVINNVSLDNEVSNKFWVRTPEIPILDNRCIRTLNTERICPGTGRPLRCPSTLVSDGIKYDSSSLFVAWIITLYVQNVHRWL